MLLGWNLLLNLPLPLNRLLTLSRSLDHSPRARPGVEDFLPQLLGLLHVLGDRGRRKRGQALVGDHIFRAVNRDVRDLARLINPAITIEFGVRLLAKILHRFEREIGRLIAFSWRALQQRFGRQLTAGLDLSRWLP